MSEKIYTWLLRFFLPRFYEAYGDAALELLRERSRDEKGFLQRLRLWLDLLADLAISLFREHRFPQPTLIASSERNLDGMPSFHALGSPPPRFTALLLGGGLSLMALGGFPALISHPGNIRSPLTPGEIFAAQAGDFEEEAAGTNEPGQSVTPSGFGMRALPPAAFQHIEFDAAERKRVIGGVISNLKEYYVYPDLAQKMTDMLAAHEKAGEYNSATDRAAFAELLTRQLQDVSHDRHLRVFYSSSKAPEHPPASPRDDAEFRKQVERDNCAFKKVEILPHNLGYVKFNAFAPPAWCGDTAAAAMGFLAHADAIIFDLRDNHGGDPHMVAFIATYLFSHPTHLNDIYNRHDNSTEQYWTLADVPGKRLADKPAYVLTSSETFSGGEEFCYDLKNLKRATLVGETTGGGAHLVDGHRIDDHFGIGVPFARAINPISKKDWEGAGVVPDVNVKAADALAIAEKLAEGRLKSK
ncbi:MAG: S41 family peptidase [Acidobacteriaceae bacterium]|nr:S41 family peptidase [Acidobacteriaceae bacterium]MBV9781372.1 S41 family peptidase [Acidobacteriaceae bacterium]